MKNRYLILILFSALLSGCGKVGPLVLPKDKIDKSIISYPCDDECLERFEEEKKRQQSITLQTE
tara:strand:+ start:182 stop:373 length:192 start_codon:yes stop_codon:yes gene_type:complete